MGQRRHELDQDEREMLVKAKIAGIDLKKMVKESMKLLHGGDETLSKQEVVRRQNAALANLFNRIDQLPVVENDDGICASVDHDLILYGWKK